MVWFLSVVTEEFVSAARQGTAWSSRYNFRYGWSVLAAAASAGASFLAALCTGHAHMAKYSPWRPAKQVTDGVLEENSLSKPLMKSKSDGQIGGGRSFTSDTLRTYLTNDSRRLFVQGQAMSSQGCFLNQASIHGINDSSSLVDLTKQTSNESCNEYELQETTMEVIPAPHCSRHMPASKSDQFRNSRTVSLPQTHEYDNSEVLENDYQVQREKEIIIARCNSVSQGNNQKLVRQISMHSHPATKVDQTPDNLKELSNDNSPIESPDDSQSVAEDIDSSYIPTPTVASVPSPVSSTNSFSSRTLPRRQFHDLPRLPEHNTFSSDNGSSSPHEESTPFTDVEPPDLFSNQVSSATYNTLPHGNRRITVYSKKGNVRAATLTKGTTNKLTHV